MLLDFNKTIPRWEENPFKKNLIKYMKRIINKEEFERELAYGALSSLKDMLFISPPEKPKPMVELQDMKKKKDWYGKPREARRVIENRCFDLTAVKEYYKKLDKCKTENASNEHWLKFYYERIEKEDQVNRSKVLGALKTHGVVLK